MIPNISTQNHKPLIISQPSFKGDKDILVIDDDQWGLDLAAGDINSALRDKADEYKIHKALGGTEGLRQAKEVKPFFTVTAYNMPGLGPDAGELIRKLKEIGTKVIVNTANWYGGGDRSRKEGIEACEKYYGADKYVSQFDPDMFRNTVKALVEGKDLPKYHFQSDNNWYTRILNIFRNS